MSSSVPSAPPPAYDAAVGHEGNQSGNANQYPGYPPQPAGPGYHAGYGTGPAYAGQPAPAPQPQYEDYPNDGYGECTLIIRF